MATKKPAKKKKLKKLEKRNDLKYIPDKPTPAPKKSKRKAETPIPELPEALDAAIDQAIADAHRINNSVRKLTPKEEKFCNEYVIDCNAKQAAIRAGYSKKTAKQIGSENLSKPVVKNMIRDKQFAIRVKSQITAEMVIEGLAKVAFADMRGIATWNGSSFLLKSSEEITDEQALMISEISPTQFGLKVKLNDRVAALEKLGKHLGILTENLNVTHKNPINMDITNFTPEQAAQAYKNALKPNS